MKKRMREVMVIDQLYDKEKDLDRNNAKAQAEDLWGFKEINDLADQYFQEAKVPYEEMLEQRIVDRILSLDHSPGFFRSFLLRPALVAVSLFLILFLAVQVRSSFYKEAVNKKVASYIAFNNQALEFVVMDNMENVVQSVLQDNMDVSLIDEEELLNKVKQSLQIYLYTHAGEDLLRNNKDLINEIIDQYSGQYVNYIKENSQDILI